MNLLSNEFKIFCFPRTISVHACLDETGICWNKNSKLFGQILADDIVAGESTKDKSFVVHYFSKGGGKAEEQLKRQYKKQVFYVHDEDDAKKWVNGLNSMVRWHARVPLKAIRKVRIVVNPHSGRKKGPAILRRWKWLLELAGIQVDEEETTYSGHAIDMGKEYRLYTGHEAMIFIGGDGTVNEFLNGLLQRSTTEWQRVVSSTPIALLSAGTDNAFGKGAGTPTHEASIYCIIKRKIRPVDVVACRPNPNSPISYACCGASFGLGADIALESEATRWMGVHRYKWLKFKRTVLAPVKHRGKVKYVYAENNPCQKLST